MSARLSQLAELIGGVVSGDPNFLVDKASPLHSADATAITFAEKPEKTDFNVATRAKAAVLSASYGGPLPDGFSTIRVDGSPKAAFEKIAEFFRPRRATLERKIDPAAHISPTAKIGANVAIGPGAVIGDDVVVGDGATICPGVVLLPGAVVGESTTIFPNVVVYENCAIGKRCVLHANCVIGAYGFGYDSSTGVHRLAAQFGNVVVEDDVEIGACATVDRAAYDSTRIGEGTKIDNHVMIAHNCQIGKRNMICASVGVAGSVTTGDYVVMGGQVGVRDHIKIGTGAALGAMAGVMANVPDGARIVGIPATPEKEQMRKQAALSKLPETRKEVRTLQKQVAELETLVAELRARLDQNADAR